MNDEKPASVQEAIERAEQVISLNPALEGELDPRWQAIIDIGDFLDEQPEVIWNFIAKWGRSRDEDLRDAIGTCLLEHLLEIHFQDYFPRVEATCRQSKNFAQTFSVCAPFGQSKHSANLIKFHKLERSITHKPRSIQ